MDRVFVDYKIQSSSPDSLNETFVVKGSPKNEKIVLKIDLSQMDPSMVNSNVSGNLTIMNGAGEDAQY